MKDERLRFAVERYGTKDWNSVSESFPRRSAIQCQNRWEKFLDPQLVKGPWTEEV